MGGVDDIRALKGAYDGHVEPRSDKPAYHPRHEMVDVPFDQQSAHGLADKRGDHDGEAFDESALVEESEARARQTGSCCRDGNRVEDGTLVDALYVPDGVFDQEHVRQ